ncbi:hypothetical protein C1H46_045633 [Malus baccata]|uniref:Uncharacterized protein n=1 Tax=Malus baccata TaxID=106549 RepID=A0A540K3N2_MALBA|nr:hypothetical protein C1H46_045633 [Malus baccata]
MKYPHTHSFAQHPQSTSQPFLIRQTRIARLERVRKHVSGIRVDISGDKK